MLGMMLALGPGYLVNSQTINPVDTSVNPANATATAAIDAAGAVTMTNQAGFQMVTQGNPADLEIRVTGTGDTPTGSAVESWLAMGGALSWTLATSGVSFLAFNGTYSVRIATTGIVIGGGSFSISATES